MAGSEVRLSEPTRGDAVLAGGQVQVNAPVEGDGVVAGGTLELSGPFGDDLYAAGGQVRLLGKVEGNGRLAGGEVTLSPESAIGGGVSIGAGRAEIAGSIGRYLHVAAGSTRVSGRVMGDVDVTGGELQLEDGAVVEGTVTFRGPEPARVAPGARVLGEVRHVPGGETAGDSWIGAAMFGLIAWIGTAIVAAVLWALSPGFTRAVAENAARRTGTALLAGIALAGGGPIVILMLFASIIGIPLALLAVYAYLVLYPLGYLAGVVSVTEWLLERMRPGRAHAWRERLPLLLAVLFGAFLLAAVPVLGWLCILTLTLIGMGAIALAATGRRRGIKETQPVRTPPTAGEWTPADERAPAST